MAALEKITSDSIKEVAILGAGKMGLALAELYAKSGVNVIMLDSVDGLAATQLAALKKREHPPLAPEIAGRITTGNYPADLQLLKNTDWVVEAIIEDPDAKRAVYAELDKVCKADCIISSNTTGIRNVDLRQGMPPERQKFFLTTHFFNPPHAVTLLELMPGPDTNPDVTAAVKDFAATRLKRAVVPVNDVHLYGSNRVGFPFQLQALKTAQEQGISVVEADAALKAVGMPAGAFQLMDIVQLSLVAHEHATMSKLPEDSYPRTLSPYIPQIIVDMLAQGKGSFYRDKGKTAINLATLEYETATKPNAEVLKLAQEYGGLRKLMESEDRLGKYARTVMLHTLSHAVQTVGDIADSPQAIDTLMTEGFKWQKGGPFALIDSLGDGLGEGKTGAQWLVAALEKGGMAVPALLKAQAEKGERFTQASPKQAWLIAQTKNGSPLHETAAGQIWDAGDGVLALNITTPMGVQDMSTHELIKTAREMLADEKYKGLMIVNDVSYGADLKFFEKNNEAENPGPIRKVIERGVQEFAALSASQKPVVHVSRRGTSYGGGTELTMAAHSQQLASGKTFIVLPEVGAGLLPAWRGASKGIGDRIRAGKRPMEAVMETFEVIANATPAKTADDAKAMYFLNKDARVSVNPNAVYQDGKQQVLDLAVNFKAPEPVSFELLPGARNVLGERIKQIVRKSEVPVYPGVLEALADAMTANNKQGTITEADIDRAITKAFMDLSMRPETHHRMAHVRTNKGQRLPDDKNPAIESTGVKPGGM